MGKRFTASQDQLKPDAIYGSLLASKFVNCLMLDGKKSVAQRIFYDALSEIKRRYPDEEAIEVFTRALENVRPSIEVRSKRVGGATYQVPVEVRPSRRKALAMRWLVDYARSRGEKSMPQRLAGELIDAVQGKGGAVKKREDVHRMAEANKAFSHFRF